MSIGDIITPFSLTQNYATGSKDTTKATQNGRRQRLEGY